MGFHIARSLSIFALAFGSVAAVACYDSRWGERERSQRHNAEHYAPAALSAAGTGAPLSKHTFRVRIYATPKYAAQTVDWKKDTRDIIEAANRLLEPELGAHLAVDGMTSWDPQLGDDDLQTALEAVAQNDAGKDADWIIALVGGLPKYTLSFHQLGRGAVLGKHIVLRAGTDLVEHDSFEKALDELSPSERMQLIHERTKHRAVAVLLHELGHTLGAIHDTTPHALMLPIYDPKMDGFGPAASEVLHASIEHRDDPPGNESALTLAKELLALYEGKTGIAWDATERTGMIAQLKARIAALSPKAPPTVATVAPSSSSTTTGTAALAGPKPPDQVAPLLAEKDRPTYAAAYDRWKAGDVKGAREIALPLFAAYPDVYGVQDFRCQLAMAQTLPWDVKKAECAQLMKLSTKK
jgi:hypothetical protein